jgi:hypothetical protein
MKAFFVALIIGVLASCKGITPGNYEPNSPLPPDTSHWQNQYTNGGLLPVGATTSSPLIGTTWVLTKFVAGFSTSFPNDTLRFIGQSTYTINGGSERPYQLTAGVASTNKSLSLYYFSPFGGSHYSGQVGYTFISDGFIDNAEFKNIQNSTSKIRAWFVKI